jgi:hypothetical protein
LANEKWTDIKVVKVVFNIIDTVLVSDVLSIVVLCYMRAERGRKEGGGGGKEKGTWLYSQALLF